MESEKQQGVMGGKRLGLLSPQPANVFRWLAPTRSQVAGRPERCSLWGPPLGRRGAQERDVGGVAAGKNPDSIPEPLLHSTRGVHKAQP